jgi:protein-disulfide isomerase
LGSEHFELLVIDVVGQIDHAVAMGVVATPAIAIDGKLAFTGLPGPKPLLKKLRAALSENAMRNN